MNFNVLKRRKTKPLDVQAAEFANGIAQRSRLTQMLAQRLINTRKRTRRDATTPTDIWPTCVQFLKPHRLHAQLFAISPLTKGPPEAARLEIARVLVDFNVNATDVSNQLNSDRFCVTIPWCRRLKFCKSHFDAIF